MTSVGLTRITMGAIIILGLLFYKPLAYLTAGMMILAVDRNVTIGKRVLQSSWRQYGALNFLDNLRVKKLVNERGSTETMHLHEKNQLNQNKYNITAWFYDILDYPWKLQYRKWRPSLVGGMHGEVLEAGVVTGRNLKYYQADINLTALDFSPSMLRRAVKRARKAVCSINFVHEDACSMESVPSDHYDWVLATFLCCVIPGELQQLAIEQFIRVLKPGGQFRLLEMMYSNNPTLKKRQDFFTPFVEKVYEARFDRNTLKHLQKTDKLIITCTKFLKHDTYLLSEGICTKWQSRYSFPYWAVAI